MSGYLLEGKELTKEFPAGRNKTVHAVTNVSLGRRPSAWWGNPAAANPPWAG